MKLAVIGLGKLGYPMAEFLSSSGYSINCYDKNEKTISKLIKNKTYLKFENGLKNLISNGNKLVIHSNIQEALKESDICFITVPTPSKSDGSFNNNYIIYYYITLYDIIYSDWLDGRCLSLYCTNNAG